MRIDDRTTVGDYLVLSTWEAITLLGQARELSDAGEISEIIAEAETILISVLSELPRALAHPADRTKLDISLSSLAEEAANQAPFEHRPRGYGRGTAKSSRSR